MPPPDHDRESNRRSEDLYAPFLKRLDSLESAHRELKDKVTTLDSSVTVMKLEQGHLKELFDARFRIIEKGNEANGSKLDSIKEQINISMNDVEKTPIGRALLSAVKSVEDTCVDHGNKIDGFDEFKKHVEGVILVVKFVVTPAALTALIVTLGRWIAQSMRQ